MRYLVPILLTAWIALGGCETTVQAPEAGAGDNDAVANTPTPTPAPDVPERHIDAAGDHTDTPVEDTPQGPDDTHGPDDATGTEDTEVSDIPSDVTPDEVTPNDAAAVDTAETSSGDITPPPDVPETDSSLGPVDATDADGLASDEIDAGPCMTCVDAEAPAYSLMDFQPQSADFETSYGLEAFLGKVTVVGLLATWCGYCKLQATMLEEMSFELELEGADVHMVIVNKVAAESTQQNFIDIVSFPLLQDVVEVNAWDLHQGSKDDLYIYGPGGQLITYLPHGGEIDTNLSADTGYQNVLQAILEAVKDTSAL